MKVGRKDYMKEGLYEGRKEGRKEGLYKGRKVERKNGRKEGRKEGRKTFQSHQCRCACHVESRGCVACATPYLPARLDATQDERREGERRESRWRMGRDDCKQEGRERRWAVGRKEGWERRDGSTEESGKRIGT
jgi:hypothetical protein